MNWAANLYQTLGGSQAPALWTPQTGLTSYGELAAYVRRLQAALGKRGFGPGDTILLLDQPNPLLYAISLAAMAMGGSVLLLEPWLKADRLNEIIALVKPKIFWSPWLGQVWALRLKELRKIPHWLKPQQAIREADPRHFIQNAVDPEHAAIMAFSSGTSGIPKGIPRSHRYLHIAAEKIQQIDAEKNRAPALVIFPNFVFYHLTQGRLSYLIPSRWPLDCLQSLSKAAPGGVPRSVAAGPAFAHKICEHKLFPELSFLALGGALMDRSQLEGFLQHWPEAVKTLIYGSTEVEPVASSPAQLALQKAKEQDDYQILYLGQAVPSLQIMAETDSLWVAGPHVTDRYIRSGPEDAALKRKDKAGVVWHNMGDRIQVKEDGLWYRGRSFQNPKAFLLEQAIYRYLQSSRCFIFEAQDGRWILVGENIQARRKEIQAKFPECAELIEAPIYRDLRHRSRIDRVKSFAKFKAKFR